MTRSPTFMSCSAARGRSELRHAIPKRLARSRICSRSRASSGDQLAADDALTFSEAFEAELDPPETEEELACTPCTLLELRRRRLTLNPEAISRSASRDLGAFELLLGAAAGVQRDWMSLVSAAAALSMKFGEPAKARCKDTKRQAANPSRTSFPRCHLTALRMRRASRRRSWSSLRSIVNEGATGDDRYANATDRATSS